MVLRVLIDNPPTNLYEYKLISDIYDLVSSRLPENITVNKPPSKTMIFSRIDQDI